MPVTVLVPGALRGEVDGASKLSIDASGTLDEILSALAEGWPRLARRVCDEQGEIRKFVNVYVNGEDVRRGGGRATEVPDGAEIQLIPSVAGG